MRSQPSSCRGFTLVEMMVTVVIIVVATAVAAPMMAGFTATMRARNAAFEMMADLTLARSEALKRNTAVTVTAKAGGWANGWRVMDGASMINDHGALASDLALALSSNASSIDFDASGRMLSATSNLTFQISSSHPEVEPRCIRITPSGTTRTKHGGC